MSNHIAARKGEIAPTVLMAGDPLRVKWIAENFLESAECYTQIRGMLGYTGYYQGKRLSVQGHGIGIPSIALYLHELITSYEVKTVIRTGSCGTLQPHVKMRDLVIAMAASTDSAFNHRTFPGLQFAPTANFDLLRKADAAAREKGIPAHVGNILSTDKFYDDLSEQWKLWSQYGVLAVEMETTALYTLAARHGIQALTLLTVSDSLITGEVLSIEERESGFVRMIETALAIIE
jgi:purine-nucleoside phosphorylase